MPRRRREAWVLHNPWTALGWSQPETVQGAGTVLKITGDDYRGRRLISWIGEDPVSGGAHGPAVGHNSERSSGSPSGSTAGVVPAAACTSEDVARMPTS